MYEKIVELRKEILDLTEGANDRKHLMMLDSIDNFFECETYKKYEFILDFCKKNGFNRVFDIGCAYGLQSEIFLNTEVDYVGIDEWNLEFWNNDNFKYIINRYPFKIEAKDDDLAVSSLCLTWNCYLYDGDETLRKQCEALQRDFKQCLLYMQEDKIDFVNQYFKKVKILDGNFVYFTNKKN